VTVSLFLRGLIFGVIVGGAMPMHPASGRSLAQIRQSGQLEIGINPALPPLAQYDAHNRLEGFDVDLGRQLAGALGVAPVFVTLPSAGRIPYLIAGKVDIVLGGLTRTPDRASAIAFSRPLYHEEFAIVSTGAARPQTIDDLIARHARLVEVRGSTAVYFLQKRAPGLPMLLLASYPDAVRALAQGRGDAMIDVIEYVGRFLKAEPDIAWQIARGIAPDAGEDCIGVAQDDSELLHAVDRVVGDFERDGVIRALYWHWFGVLPSERAP